ncbi:MAG: SCO family protein [Bacteroidetes bacterium]|jgi:protein SCO1/2|nr:SCO family protein [Bacteroidota bacterium]
MLRHALTVLIALGALGPWLWADDALAQRSGQSNEVYDEVDLQEKLGEQVATDATFYNEAGEAVRLATYFDGETPVVLSLVYHNCPMLCSLILDGVTNSLRDLEWTPGDEFEKLTVSFNAIETPDVAKRQKDRYLAKYGRPKAADGWHFLTGDEAAIAQLTESVGFTFKWVEDQQEYAHPAVLIFISGDGTITRYLHGMEYPERDMRNALVEASEGRVGSVVDRAIMYCFKFDPSSNSYVLHAWNLMKLGSILGALALGGVLLVFWRRENKQLSVWDEAHPSAAT